VARSRTILVAGAGIGGLAAAIELAKAGFRTVVLERAKKLEEIGAGIQLTPNAVRALERLGALAAVKKRAVAANALIVGAGDSGDVLARATLGEEAARRFGAPCSWSFAPTCSAPSQMSQAISSTSCSSSTPR